MKKAINVVIIDDNNAVLSSVKKYFWSNAVINLVEVFNNGRDGLDYLMRNPNSYDLVVLDILLPQIDGIRILETLKANNITKKVIVLSSYKDDYTIRQVQKLGANYYMLKPFSMESLEKRIIDIMQNESERQKLANNTIEIEVSNLLHDLGIPSHVRGYQYIREGIILIYTKNKPIALVTKEIYPAIANKYETTPSRVERAIRHAIEVSWLRGDIHKMEDLFGNSIDFERSRPTNSEFLTTLADSIKIKSRNLIG